MVVHWMMDFLGFHANLMYTGINKKKFVFFNSSFRVQPGTSATTTTITENYNSIPNYTAYKRVTVTTVGSPAPGMKTITATAF